MAHIMLESLLRGGAGVIGRNLGNSNEHEKRKFEHFILNLKRMTGITNAVTPDTMYEFCAYIHNESIVNATLMRVEQLYTASLFDNDDLDVAVCSIEVSFASFCSLFYRTLLFLCLIPVVSH